MESTSLASSLPAIAVAVIVMGCIVMVLYNGIIAAANGVQRAWAGVIAYERQKNEVIPRLEAVVRDGKLFEQGLLTRITELRSALGALDPQRIDPAAVERATALTQSVLQGVRMTLEAYPEVKAISLIQGQMDQIGSLEENVAAAISIFNQTVETHNNKIAQFPGNLVNSTLNHRKRVTPFNNTAASSSLGYAPNV